jgi:hypothetical protein
MTKSSDSDAFFCLRFPGLYASCRDHNQQCIKITVLCKPSDVQCVSCISEHWIVPEWDWESENWFVVMKEGTRTVDQSSMFHCMIANCWENSSIEKCYYFKEFFHLNLKSGHHGSDSSCALFTKLTWIFDNIKIL